jgi:hypothetical protein
MDDIPKGPVLPSEEVKSITELYKNDKLVRKSKIGSILGIKKIFNIKLKKIFTILRDILDKSIASLAETNNKKNTFNGTPEYKGKLVELKGEINSLKDHPDYKMIKNYPEAVISKYKVSKLWKDDQEKKHLANIAKLFYIYANTYSLFEYEYDKMQDNIGKSKTTELFTTSLATVKRCITDLEKDTNDTDILEQQLSAKMDEV